MNEDCTIGLSHSTEQLHHITLTLCLDVCIGDHCIVWMSVLDWIHRHSDFHMSRASLQGKPVQNLG